MIAKFRLCRDDICLSKDVDKYPNDTQYVSEGVLPPPPIITYIKACIFTKRKRMNTTINSEAITDRRTDKIIVELFTHIYIAYNRKTSNQFLVHSNAPLPKYIFSSFLKRVMTFEIV